MEGIVACIPEYEELRGILNGNFNDADAIRNVITAFNGLRSKGISIISVAKNLQNFGFSPYPLQRSDDNTYNFAETYDNLPSGGVFQSNSIAVSYTQQPGKTGKASMPNKVKNNCNTGLALIKEKFKMSSIAVWFDKLAIKQAESAQTYWAITSNLMFLAFPVLSIAPRYDHYNIERSVHENRLKSAGLDTILNSHAKRIAQCHQCWKYTHAACAMQGDVMNRQSMVRGGLWVDGWLRCWPEVERRLGALNKGTYVTTDDFLLLLDTYMLVCNIAKTLFSDNGVGNNNSTRDTTWLTELAWLQRVSSEKLDSGVDDNAWCSACNSMLMEDIMSSVSNSPSRENNWTSTIQLLQAMKESVKYVSPLQGMTMCCQNECCWKKTIDAYGKFNNDDKFGCVHNAPSNLYNKLVKEYIESDSVQYPSLYRMVCEIAYDAPGQADCYREGDKMGAIVSLMNLPILAPLISTADKNTNIYKTMVEIKTNSPAAREVWFTGVDYGDIMPMQLYKPLGINDYVALTGIGELETATWLGSLQTGLKQAAFIEFLNDIGIQSTEEVKKRVQYESIRQINAVGWLHVSRTDQYPCPNCSTNSTHHWVSYTAIASLNPAASLTLAENNVGGKWNNSKIFIYNDCFIGQGHANISKMHSTLVRCHGCQHKFLRSVVSLGDFVNNCALIELRQCNIEENTLLLNEILSNGDCHLADVIRNILS